MLEGKYEPGPVIEATLRIYVNGKERPHTSAKWAIDTPGGLPESIVNAGTGIRSRTGSITWAQDTAIAHTPFAPIGEGRWVPRDGDDVIIEAEVAGQVFRRFTGRLGKTTASLTSDTLTSEITDRLGDALQEVMSIEPQVTYNNGYTRSGWLAYRAIEQAGLGGLPRVEKNTVIHSGMQQGALPAVGKTIVAGPDAVDRKGFNIRSGVIIGVGDTPPSRGGRGILAVARSASFQPSRLSIYLDDQTHVRLNYAPATQSMQLWVNAALAWEGTYVGDEDPALLAMHVRPNGSIRVWISRGTPVETGGYATEAAAQLVSAGGDMIAGLTAQYLWTDSQADAVLASTVELMPRLNFSSLEQNYLSAIRGYENVTAREIVDSWCQATLGAIWMDEYGRVNLVARDRLVTSVSTGTEKVAEKVFTGAWETGRDSIRSRVIVEGTESIHHGTWIGSTATVYQPSSIIEIEKNAPQSEFISIPDEEDWIEVDTAWRPVMYARGGQNNVQEFDSTSSGSWWQIGFEQPGDSEGVRWTGPQAETLSASLERLGQRTLKMTHTVLSGGSYKYILATPTLGVEGLRLSRRGKPTPIIRAKWRVVWAKFARTGAATGPAWAPSMKLESSFFLEPDDAQRVADSLAAEVTQESITFSSLQMLWNPLVQVGDTRTLIGTGFDGIKTIDAWEAEYLVTGYSEAWEGNVPTWEVDAQCKRLRDLRAGKTYKDLAAAYGTYGAISGQYGQVYAALPGKV